MRLAAVRVTPAQVAAAFLASGTVHLVRPRVFESMIPKVLPRPREIVYVSGVAELVCAAGLLTKARWSGPASAAVLLAVWPGNLQMALDTTRTASPTNPVDVVKVAAVWARMPLQIAMIKSVLRANR